MECGFEACEVECGGETVVIPMRLSVVLKIVELELSCNMRHTREVECGVEAGGAGVELK